MSTTAELALYILSLIGGLGLLVWSADIFIMGATAIALYSKISPLIIGIVIVGCATSAPEYIVSLMATFNGSQGLSFGNILGSNITNISLGLGLPALFSCIVIPKAVARREVNLLLITTILALVLLYQGHFSRLDATLLICIFFSSMAFSIWSARKKYQSSKAPTPQISKGKAILSLIVGISTLIGASQLLVYGATNIAHVLGVSDLMIGLTIVAVGTSLPEIASSCLAVIRNEPEMAFGNIIGSNLFNLLLVLGTIGVISPTNVPVEVIVRDGLTMLTTTILLALFSLGPSPRITRIQGGILVLLYIAYICILIATERGILTI